MDLKTSSICYPEVHIIWEIKNFYKALPDTKYDTCLKSAFFDFANVSWCLEIAIRGIFSPMTCMVSTWPKIMPESEIACMVGLKNSDGSICKIYKNVKEAPYHLQPPYLFSIEINEILDSKDRLSKNGTLTFFCNLCRMDIESISPRKIPTINLRENSSQTLSLESLETLSSNFEQLLAAGLHSDVKFKVGSREFPAHKSVLAARSPVLESMFSHEMLENSRGVVDIIDCDESIFQDFLAFLYSGRVNHIPSGNIAALYEIAEKYDCQPLKVECAKQLEVELSIDLVCDALHIAVVYDEKNLLESATDFFIGNAKAILVTPQWKSFIKEHTEFGTHLILKCVNN